MLLVDNSDEQFNAYQWYHNGSVISGEVKQYYYSSGGLTEEYYCQVTTNTGDEFVSNTIDLSSTSSASMAVFPSPALKGNTITIQLDYAEDENREESVVKVYSLTGQLVKQLNNVYDVTQIMIDKPGIYIIKCQGAVESSKKLIVR